MEERKNIFDFDEHAPTVIKTENEVYEFDKKENQNIVFDKDKTNIDILVCQCGDVNHQLVFTYWPADKNLKDIRAISFSKIHIHHNRHNNLRL